jgi:acyl CoA:acetate/3-ketoacid CoA transferase
LRAAPVTATKLMRAEAAAALVPDNATVAVTGAGGGLVEPDAILAAIEARFLSTGHPRGLTVVHALGIGDRESRGINRFAHEGMVAKAIGGHWTWSPRMQALARAEKIEAYVLPGGVISQLMREIGAGRPGLYTHVGLGTFVDPRLEGGRVNARAKDVLVELVEIDGRELLRYRPFKVDIGIVRGSFADAEGNVSLDREGANLDAWAVALAAHNSGGRTLVQVGQAVEAGALPARSVRVPAPLVDAVVVEPGQRQSYAEAYDPSLSGERRVALPEEPAPPLSARQAIARRAAAELRPGAVINFGFGIPDGVAKLIAARGQLGHYYQTIEHGTYGGALLDGMLFGYARNATAMLDSPSQFDFYGGGGLDLAFLGMGELDGAGNVNVSRLNGEVVGPGGFIDIAQNARTVVFCGTFETKGSAIDCGGGRLTIRRPGAIAKLVEKVEQITFSGAVARRAGQEVVYVTERAVFRLGGGGVVLSEVAPGVDLQRDVLSRMRFRPLMPAPPALMAAEHFTA